MKKRLRAEITQYSFLKERFSRLSATQITVLVLIPLLPMLLLKTFTVELGQQHARLFSGILGGLSGVLVYFLAWAWEPHNPKGRVPRNARFLILLLMPNASGDALLGDLEERFDQIVNDKTLGPRYAYFWYWFQVMISLRSLVLAVVKRITGLTIAYEAIRRAIK